MAGAILLLVIQFLQASSSKLSGQVEVALLVVHRLLDCLKQVGCPAGGIPAWCGPLLSNLGLGSK